MRAFCTVLDAATLEQGRCLLHSLSAHAVDPVVFVLCLDVTTAQALGSMPAPLLKRIGRTELLDAQPELAPASLDRTAHEFRLTCKPWLMRHILPQLPAGTLLTLLDPELFFFSSPSTVEPEIGTASVAIVTSQTDAQPQFAPERGRFSAGWVTLRNDATGRACAERWAQECREWCFLFPEAGRHAEQKYLDGWPRAFPGTVILTHPGLGVAPWNLAGRALTVGPDGPLIAGQPVVCFHFGGLRHLHAQLYEPGLLRHGVNPDAILREQIYQPYLHAVARNAANPPDIVPPANPADPRIGAILPYLATELQRAEAVHQAAVQALHRHRIEAQRLVDDLLGRERESARYTREVEVERDEQRQAFFDTRQKLEAFHLDLLRNIEYLKKLEAEAAAHRQASLEREAYISSLKEQLAEKWDGGGTDLAKLYQALSSHGQEIRRLLVARYHAALLPAILTLSSQGVSIEILESPLELAGKSRGGVHFLPGSLWDWLIGLNSLFDEAAYLRANPDIAAAVTAGAFRSGWEHYQRFGQLEDRPSGTLNFRSGLADFDAVAFDSADAGPLLPCIIGRLQVHHRLFVSSSFNPATVWLPIDTPREIVLEDLLCCPHPPAAWLGPRQPSALAVPHRTPPTTAELYPSTPSQPAVWPKISVISVNRDNATALEETLRSVLAQGYPALEFLVVDRDSADGSVEVLRRHADQLAWWVSEPAATEASALNRGLAQSTGTILCWLDGGDQLAPGSLFTAAEQFLLHDPDLLAGRCTLPSAPGAAPRIHRSVLTPGQVQPLPLAELGDVERCWLPGWFFLQPEVFFSRRILERIGGRVSSELRHNPGYELWLRCARAGGQVLAIPEILAQRRTDTLAPSPEALAELHAVSSAQRGSLGPTSV